jgi:hypothetical protein
VEFWSARPVQLLPTNGAFSINACLLHCNSRWRRSGSRRCAMIHRARLVVTRDLLIAVVALLSRQFSSTKSGCDDTDLAVRPIVSGVSRRMHPAALPSLSRNPPTDISGSVPLLACFALMALVSSRGFPRPTPASLNWMSRPSRQQVTAACGSEPTPWYRSRTARPRPSRPRDGRPASWKIPLVASGSPFSDTRRNEQPMPLPRPAAKVPVAERWHTLRTRHNFVVP